MLKHTSLLVVSVATCLLVPATVLADYYDTFDDGFYERDPNDPRYDANDPYWTDPNNAVLWDVDNPDWTIIDSLGDDFGYWVNDAGALHIAAVTYYWPFTFIACAVTDGSADPNTSLTHYDDSAAHYVLAKVNPFRSDGGEVILFLHANLYAFETYTIGLECDDDQLTIANVNAATWWAKGNQIRNDLDEENGFWMVLQWEGDGDPNHSYVRGAAWNGEKYDWDGVWDIDLQPAIAWDPNHPVHHYWSEGECGGGAVGSSANSSPNSCAAAFDNFEVRWGTFTNASHTLQLGVKNASMGTITIDPDLLDDLNQDPNDQELQRRYTAGTEVVLVAEPLEGKSFKGWTVFDPNHPGDRDYAVEDTNSVLYLTMNADWGIEAAFACGSSELLPPMGMVLLALTLGLLVRRRG